MSLTTLQLRHGLRTKGLAQRLWFRSAAPAITHALGEPLFERLGRRESAASFDLSQVRRVLVVRLDKIGDIVLTTPFFRELRRNLPAAAITLLVTPAALPLVENCPYLDDVQTYNWRHSRYFGPLHHLHALGKARGDLWRQRFDLAIVPCWGVDYYLATFLAYFSGAQWRLGYSEHVTENKRFLNRGFDRLFTHSCGDDVVRHEVEHNLELIRFIGGDIERDDLELWTTAADEKFVDDLWREHGLANDELVVGIAPGAGAVRRQWPVDSYARLARWLVDQYNARVVILGGPGEENLGRTIASAVDSAAIDLTARASLTQTASALRRCRLFIGNDSGPMHLAAAAGTPCIEISCHPADGNPAHENSPRRFGPWGSEHTVLQPERASSPCTDCCSSLHAHCITTISLDTVQRAVLPYLTQHDASGLVASAMDIPLRSARS
jgi:heptosyltransferase-2